MKKLVILAVLGIASILSACSTSGDVGGVDGGTAQAVSGQVANYTGPAGTLEAKDTINAVDVGVGSINADGTFRLELGGTPPDLTGKSILPRGCPELNVSDSSVQGVALTQINVIADGESVGVIAQGGVSGDSELTITSVGRTYVDRDVTITGTCVASSPDGEVRANYNLNYQRGWNVARAEISSNADNSVVTSNITSVTASEVEDIGWSYLPTGTNDDPTELPATPSVISGQVQNYTGPAGTLTASNGSGEPMDIGAGSISADGSFSFELDNLVSEAALQPLGSPEGCTGIEISNPDTKIAGVLELLVMSGDDSVGLLKLSVRSGSNSRTETQWLYADQAVTVQGTCEYSSTSSTDKDTYNLDLKRGWNIISVDQSSSYDAATDIQAFEFNFYNGQAAGVEWSYIDYQ